MASHDPAGECASCHAPAFTSHSPECPVAKAMDTIASASPEAIIAATTIMPDEVILCDVEFPRTGRHWGKSVNPQIDCGMAEYRVTLESIIDQDNEPILVCRAHLSSWIRYGNSVILAERL